MEGCKARKTDAVAGGIIELGAETPSEGSRGRKAGGSAAAESAFDMVGGSSMASLARILALLSNDPLRSSTANAPELRGGSRRHASSVKAMRASVKVNSSSKKGSRVTVGWY